MWTVSACFFDQRFTVNHDKQPLEMLKVSLELSESEA